MAAVTAVESLMHKHQVVGLSELHYNQEIWDLVADLLKNGALHRSQADIALEGGNSGMQALMDRYVGGADVPEAEIKRVWRSNTQVNTTYDAPVYLRMLRQVRTANLQHPQAMRIRVILLDPDIDWSTVTGAANYMPFLLDREPSMARVIERETYARGRKLLFVAGGPHVERTPVASPFKSALTMLEQAHPNSTFNVAFYSGFGVEPAALGALESLFDGWPKPGVALLTGTALGSKPAGINTAAKGPDGKLIDLYPGVKLEQVFDAILYAGRRGALRTSSPSDGVCTGKAEDEAWKLELLARQALVEVPPPLRTTLAGICTPLPPLYFDQDIFK